MTDAIDIRDVHISFKHNHVIEDLNLKVAEGSTFGLIGLNGVGKTTLIKAVLGLRTPDKGKINILGYDVADPHSKNRYTYLPERFDPPWFLKGMEFIKFALNFYGKAITDAEARLAAESLALDPDALNRQIQGYSKGMRQKLGLISVLLSPCDLLVLDEPMSGLDPRARKCVKSALIKAREDGRTIFLSSHILADMNEICDEVAVLHERRILYHGRPGEILKQFNTNNLEDAFLQIIDEKEAA